jgi:hypothetical protein
VKAARRIRNLAPVGIEEGLGEGDGIAQHQIDIAG